MARKLSEKEYTQRINAARAPRSKKARKAASERMKAVHAAAKLIKGTQPWTVYSLLPASGSRF
jgi:hypothetical protein